MFKIYDGRSEMYQWDLDRKIVVSDPTINEVHFCNKTSDCSLVVEVEEVTIFADNKETKIRTANVPNILLQTSWPIHVYAYCGDCYTKASATFKVIARTKPDDYVYTETEVKRWEALEERVDEKLALIDALDETKLDRVNVTSGTVAYIHTNGKDGVKYISQGTYSDSIPTRTAKGEVRTATATVDDAAVPLKQMKDYVAENATGSKLYRHDITLWAGYMEYIFEICFSYYSNDATPRTRSVVDDDTCNWIYDEETGEPLQITEADVDFIPTDDIISATGYLDNAAQSAPRLVTGISRNGVSLNIAGYPTNEEYWYASYSRAVSIFSASGIEKIIDNVTEIVLSPLENGDEVAY